MTAYDDPRGPQGQPLTRRERACVLALACGCTNPQIAERLHICVRTVRNHLYVAYQKMGVTNRTAAAMKALRLAAL